MNRLPDIKKALKEVGELIKFRLGINISYRVDWARDSIIIESGGKVGYIAYRDIALSDDLVETLKNKIWAINCIKCEEVEIDV
jgi:hypothetical protein